MYISSYIYTNRNIQTQVHKFINKYMKRDKRDIHVHTYIHMHSRDNVNCRLTIKAIIYILNYKITDLQNTEHHKDFHTGKRT